MADQLLDQVRDVVEGQIDFEGQKLCDQLATILLSAVGVVAFIVGYILQDITLCLYILLGGSVLVSAIIIPPWPFFNKHPVKWLPVGGQANTSYNIPQTVVFEK